MNSTIEGALILFAASKASKKQAFGTWKHAFLPGQELGFVKGGSSVIITEGALSTFGKTEVATFNAGSDGL